MLIKLSDNQTEDLVCKDIFEELFDFLQSSILTNRGTINLVELSLTLLCYKTSKLKVATIGENQ